MVRMDNPLLGTAALPAFGAIRPEHVEPAVRQVLDDNRRGLQELLAAGATGWDGIVVVDAPDEVRLERLVARGVDREDGQRRMAAQVTRDARLAAADHVVDNSGDLASLERAVDALWMSLTSTGT